MERTEEHIRAYKKEKEIEAPTIKKSPPRTPVQKNKTASSWFSLLKLFGGYSRNWKAFSSPCY